MPTKLTLTLRAEIDVNRKIAIGVVTYKPDVNLTLRLQRAIDFGFSIYVFDNSPADELIRSFCQRFKNEEIRYTTCGKNLGLGIGISSVCAQAYYESFPALIFFDQDTVFDHATLDFAEEFYKKNRGIASYYSAFWFNSKKYAGSDVENDFMFKDVLMAINSGSLFILENLKKINWMNESYFVDGVDYEFCLNSNNNNLKIGECSSTPGFDHEAEQDDSKYVIFGKIYTMREYSLIRVKDAVFAYTRLLVSSIRTNNFQYAMAIVRLLVGYIYYQTVVRLFRNTKLRETGE